MPSLGGTLIGFALQALQETRIENLRFGSVAHLETLARTMEITDLMDREEISANAGTCSDSYRTHTDPELLAAYRSIIESHAASTRGTTQISIMDDGGEIASMTLSNGEGCGYIVPGCGFMLNNMLGEEDLNPAGFERWAPASRMASMMAPTLVFGENCVLASGSARRYFRSS